ncbi:MAG: patatin-like phospholipase family protein, partial [Bacteroidota bacterium]
ETLMYKILSLDGGGSWSILQLLTLKEKYGNISGHEILKDFDLVLANSGGSIVLAALVENYSLQKAIDIFLLEKNRSMIFSKNRYAEKFIPVSFFSGKFGPKYSTKRKKEAFDTLFNTVSKIPMERLPDHVGKPSLKISIATFDALNNRARFFKSYGSEKDTFDSISITQAIHGSSNAPIQYFDFPAKMKAKNSNIWYYLWDGALGGFNNPTVAALIEAIKADVSLDSIKLISIGTGTKLMSVEDKKEFYDNMDITIRNRFKKLRFSTWKRQISYFFSTVVNQAKTILYEPPDWANYVAMMFLRQAQNKDIPNNFIRLSPMIHIGKDTPEKVKPLLRKLYKLDMDLTKDEDVQLLIEAFEQWKEGCIQNQPIEYRIIHHKKEDVDELIYLTGDKFFLSAMKRW